MLYSYKGSYPKKLPERIRLSNGLTRTNSSTYTEEEITDAGYFAVSVPTYDPATQKLAWDGNVFNVQPIPPVVNWSGFYDDLLVSQTYSHLAALSVQVPNISLAVTAMAFALIKGEKDPDNSNRMAALQASVDGVLAALNTVGQSLSIEQLAEVRTMLDSNNFQSITLDGG